MYVLHEMKTKKQTYSAIHIYQSTRTSYDKNIVQSTVVMYILNKHSKQSPGRIAIVKIFYSLGFFYFPTPSISATGWLGFNGAVNTDLVTSRHFSTTNNFMLLCTYKVTMTSTKLYNTVAK